MVQCNTLVWCNRTRCGITHHCAGGRCGDRSVWDGDDAVYRGDVGVSFGGGWGPQVGRGIVCMRLDIIFEQHLTVLLERWLHD